MTRSIAARGRDALTNDAELQMEMGTADLYMKHSQSGPGAMKLSVFSDLLYGISHMVYDGGLFVEVKLDVWDNRVHVGEGWLLNMDHPPIKPGQRRLERLKG